MLRWSASIIHALEELFRNQQRRVDKLESGETNQQRRIDQLESRIEALEREANRKRQIAAADRSTKRIKVPADEIDGLFLSLDDDLFLKIVSHLRPADLANVGRACSRFGAARDGRSRSLADEAARRMFRRTATEYEANALPRYGDESEIALLRELDLLRGPLEFGQLVGNNIRYTFAASKSSVSSIENYRWSTALSNFVMRRGKHFVNFHITKDGFYSLFLGIVRPLRRWDEKELVRFNPYLVDFSDIQSRNLLAERTERWGTVNVNCCTYNCSSGCCWWSNWTHCHHDNWGGAESTSEDGTIGMLLDLLTKVLWPFTRMEDCWES